VTDQDKVDITTVFARETNADDVIYCLQSLPVWPAIRDAFGVGGQALGLADYIRRAMNG
jgi:hypothetical protein